ncbi:MAG TPA: phenylacetate--CoA ligase, partial [Verrucomicrobiota bacterium]|nr:phenylacetate--CoA ligase [Verrucomicrobiota bacterium]
MYWQEEIETLNRAQLEALQLKRLQETVARVAACVPHYQQEFARRSFRPDALRSLSDVRRLPFTTSADLRAAYPAGLLAVPLDNTLRLHTSSG